MATILVIDDEDSIRHLLKDVLEKAKHRVLEARDGREGWRNDSSRRLRDSGRWCSLGTVLCKPVVGGNSFSVLRITPRLSSAVRARSVQIITGTRDACPHSGG